MPVLKISQIIASVEGEAAGPSYTVPRLAQSLADLGHHVELVSLGSRSTSRCGTFSHERYPPDAVWPPVLARLGRSAAMRRALMRSESDLFHAHGLWMMPNVYPADAARARGRPLVLSPRGMLGEGALKFSRGAKRAFWALAQGRAARQVACFHATAESECQDIRRFGLRQPVAVIPNGIDLPQLGGALDRAKHAGEATAPYVLSLGRIHPKKGLDRLIAAWARLAPRFPEWRLRIVGPDEGSCARALARQVDTMGLSACVSIEGPVFGADKLALMRGAEVFALSTLHENFGMTVAESLALETPVVSTHGAPWQGLEAHGCGYWVEHGAEPMAAALDAAMVMPREARRAMGARGRAWMERDFGWPGIAAQMADVYRWLCVGGERPDCVRIRADDP